MLISTLLQTLITLPQAADRHIEKITLDSRKIVKGDLFLALKGSTTDGRRFIESAINKGASAVLVEQDASYSELTYLKTVPLIPIPHLSQHVGEIAARYYGRSKKSLYTIGVTGTNGKTSCTHFIAQILEGLNIPCGLIGTLGQGFLNDLRDTGLTTPDAITMQKTLAELVSSGARVVSLEVSSHSIDQARIQGIDFDIGIFTNLTHDHLDYHGDMETYAATKRRFFSAFPLKHMILNADDAYGRKWISELADTSSVYAYGTHEFASPKAVPFIYAHRIETSLKGLCAQIETPWGHGQLSLPLMGQFNLSNALATLSALCLYGLPFEQIITMLRTIKGVPGRMQRLGGEGKPMVVVDYACTPDALSKVLATLRQHTKGKLICVFGCGGERDSDKRPVMANIAEQFADRIIVTNDNPRHENPEKIVAEICQGFSQDKHVRLILNRSQAIENSIQLATDKDCVLIAGKGAERYQQIGDEKIPFNDIDEVKACLKAL